MIYVVEDEISIQNLIVYTLKQSNFEAAGFADATTFWSHMNANIPQLILLDIMLPDESGLQILKKIRTSPTFQKIPVMILSALGTEFDKVTGLDLGADDYLPKPFGMMEMIARVKNLLRRIPATPSHLNEYQYQNISVDISKHQVFVKRQPVVLTLKEFEVLVLLLKQPGMVLTRDQIMNQVWGYDFDGETRTVDVHIRSLRTKLGESSELIQTVRGIGYRLGEIE